MEEVKLVIAEEYELEILDVINYNFSEDFGRLSIGNNMKDTQ